MSVVFDTEALGHPPRMCLNICLNINFDVQTLAKTITIRDDVYRKLLSIKHEDESFSELFERLAESVDPVETLKRLRSCVEFKDKEAMLSEISSARAERRL